MSSRHVALEALQQWQIYYLLLPFLAAVILMLYTELVVAMSLALLQAVNLLVGVSAMVFGGSAGWCFAAVWALGALMHLDLTGGDGWRHGGYKWLRWAYSKPARLVLLLVVLQLINPFTSGPKCSITEPLECVILLNLVVIGLFQARPDAFGRVHARTHKLMWF